jgi:hypothetical protein
LALKMQPRAWRIYGNNSDFDVDRPADFRSRFAVHLHEGIIGEAVTIQLILGGTANLAVACGNLPTERG